MRFNPYPFQRLRNLLNSTHYDGIGVNLSIGEPGFSPPRSIVNAIKDHAELIRFYPTLHEDLAKAQMEFVKHRFNISLHESQIIPTFGSREVLFNFPCFIFSDNKYIKKDKPVISFPNPFYQIYEGAQIANKAKVIYMPLHEKNNFKSMLSKEECAKVDMVILNSPNNPTGQILDIHELKTWVELALEYNFILINDECYSEIYMKDKPASLLQASIAAGNPEFKNIFVINSISKRLSAPGLRSGFIAGNASILEQYKTYRTYLGISMPNTLQEAAIIAWREHDYANLIREKFSANLNMAMDIFNDSIIFPFTFYLWLKIQDCDEIHLGSNRLFNDELFAKELYERTGHIVLPGSYLGRNNGGAGHVRVALTKETDIMKEALMDIKTFNDKFIAKHSCQNI